MRSVLFIVNTLRFWYKTDMHPLTIFLETPKKASKKKTVAEAEDSEFLIYK
jgi:predicted transcriptional regulator of viral defense system